MKSTTPPAHRLGTRAGLRLRLCSEIGEEEDYGVQMHGLSKKALAAAMSLVDNHQHHRQHYQPHHHRHHHHHPHPHHDHRHHHPENMFHHVFIILIVIRLIVLRTGAVVLKPSSFN